MQGTFRCPGAPWQGGKQKPQASVRSTGPPGAPARRLTFSTPTAACAGAALKALTITSIAAASSIAESFLHAGADI
jgi:hypothetical protein